MGFIENKSNVFKSVGVTKALTNDIVTKFGDTKNKLGNIKNKLGDSFKSIKSKSRNIIPFLLDLLKSLAGVKRIEDVFDKIIKSLDIIEVEVKEAIYEVIRGLYFCNYDGALPTWMTDGTLRIKVSSLDQLNLFKLDPATPLGTTLYDKNLNTFLYENVLQLPQTVVSWDGFMEFMYDDTTDEVVVKVTETSLKIDEFIKKFMNSINLFPKENIFTKFMDELFGITSNILKRSKEEVEVELKVKKILEKMIESEDNELKIVTDDSYFLFTNEELNDIEWRAENYSNGVSFLDMSCGLVETTVTEEEVLSSVANLTGSTELITLKNEIITITNKAIERSDILPEDKKTSRDFFMLEFITQLPNILLAIIMSPKLVLLFIIMHVLVTGNPNYTEINAVEFIRQHKDLFKKIAKKVLGSVVKILFGFVLKEVTKLITQISSQLIMEKLALYRKSLLSLTGGIASRVESATKVDNVSSDIDSAENFIP